MLGVAIDARPHWKTYWRSAGEAGLPPVFTWRIIENSSMPEVLWPAPERFTVQGIESYGYTEQIIFPVRIQPIDASRPVRLSLHIEYAVCQDICIPEQADLEIALAPGPGTPTPDAHQISLALAKVPVQQGAAALPRIDTAQVIGKGRKATSLLVTAHSEPPFSRPDLFIDAVGSNFLFSAPDISFNSARTEAVFTVRIHPLDPKQKLAGAALTLTLVDGSRAVEHRVVVQE